MTLVHPQSTLGLLHGPSWGSFEELRVKHAENLSQVKPGTVGDLKVKRRSFVIVDKQDFHKVEDLMKKLEDAVQQLEILSQTAAVTERHTDPMTIHLFRTATARFQAQMADLLLPSLSFKDTVENSDPEANK